MSNSTTTQSPVIVALDFKAAAPCFALLDQLDSSLCQVKVGMELFTAAGPQILTDIHKRGFNIFLDLKFLDIPNTVAGACRSAVEHGVWLLNVHASGGVRMLEAAREAVPGDGITRLIAVTMLTSMTESDLRETGVDSKADAQVARLTDLTAACGLDGVVCSPLEARQLRDRYGDDFLLVTPGVRPKGSDVGDQRRVMTPTEAVNAGSNYLVIGRPITQASDPASALEVICAELAVTT